MNTAPPLFFLLFRPPPPPPTIHPLSALSSQIVLLVGYGLPCFFCFFFFFGMLLLCFLGPWAGRWHFWGLPLGCLPSGQHHEKWFSCILSLLSDTSPAFIQGLVVVHLHLFSHKFTFVTCWQLLGWIRTSAACLAKDTNSKHCWFTTSFLQHSIWRKVPESDVRSMAGMDTNSKHWFTTSFLQHSIWRKVPESDVRSVAGADTNSKHWFTTSFLQPLLYLVTP